MSAVFLVESGPKKSHNWGEYASQTIQLDTPPGPLTTSHYSKLCLLHTILSSGEVHRANLVKKTQIATQPVRTTQQATWQLQQLRTPQLAETTKATTQIIDAKHHQLSH